MKISDAFEHKVEDPELELTCRIYNINKGKNKERILTIYSEEDYRKATEG